MLPSSESGQAVSAGSIGKEGPKTEFQFRRILIVDDDMDIRILLKTNLEYEGFKVDVVPGLSEMKKQIALHSYDAILIDIYLGEENGLDALPELIRVAPGTKVVIMTGHGSVDLAVQAMRQGAASFLIKSSDPKEIATELKATIYSQYGIAALSGEPLPDNFGIIGKSAKLREVIHSIKRVKDVDSTVLIGGESGTGKELVARGLHRLSTRAKAPFRAINCGAVPEALLESELFGHKKSSFTDAKTDRKGIFEVCSGGALLLDEIGDMSLKLQVKLLRVLQEREVTPIGASESIKVDVRVLASTHRDLRALVQSGDFREDLYYRLSVLQINLPALRERKEDIPLLVNEFLKRYNHRFDRNVRPPSHEVLARLMAYHFPGNVRELQNMIERGVVLSRDGQLSAEDLFSHTEASQPASQSGVGVEAGGDVITAPLKFRPTRTSKGMVAFEQARSEFEKDYLTQLLSMTKGNISEASRVSGEYRTKLYRLLKRYAIDINQFKYPA